MAKSYKSLIFHPLYPTVILQFFSPHSPSYIDCPQKASIPEVRWNKGSTFFARRTTLLVLVSKVYITYILTIITFTNASSPADVSGHVTCYKGLFGKRKKNTRYQYFVFEDSMSGTVHSIHICCNLLPKLRLCKDAFSENLGHHQNLIESQSHHMSRSTIPYKPQINIPQFLPAIAII